jgi:alkylhydroperoxidase/carboxymuconolactone decarboxylase family protein
MVATRLGAEDRADFVSSLCRKNTKGTEMESYFVKSDLKKFGNISRVNPNLGEKFFAYYNEAFKGGALSEREKALIGLAVAHALKCPYCIDAYSTTCLEKGADEAQMNEAVHVAASLAAGIILVHGVQMMNKVDEVSL